MKELKALLNRTLRAQPPKEVWRRIKKKRVDVAIDLVEIPYHGEPELNEAEMRRSTARSGTTHFHMYSTLAVIHHQQRFTLALTFVRLDNLLNARPLKSKNPPRNTEAGFLRG